MLEHHPLVKEFPQYRETIHRLKVGDPEFRTLFDEYHELDRRIYRIDQETEAVDDARAAQLKRRRMFLKDLLYERIQQAAASSP